MITTVTLSSPPASRVPHEDAFYLIFIDHVGETVGAKKQSISTVHG
jgi:hypothetical protein